MGWGYVRRASSCNGYKGWEGARYNAGVEGRYSGGGVGLVGATMRCEYYQRTGLPRRSNGCLHPGHTGAPRIGLLRRFF